MLRKEDVYYMCQGLRLSALPTKLSVRSSSVSGSSPLIGIYLDNIKIKSDKTEDSDRNNKNNEIRRINKKMK